MKCVHCDYEFGEGALFCGLCSNPLVNLAVLEGGLLMITDVNQAVLQRVLAPDFRVQDKLAEGGMACVYEVVDNRTEESMAFKVLPLEHANDPELIAQFERESRLLADLAHPHIMPLWDAGTLGRFQYLAMPMMRGGDLKARIQKGLHWTDALGILHQVVLALAYAHDFGLVHRDIKPANILFDQEATAYLADFGIAWLADEAEGHGQGLGTPNYASPEQLLGDNVGKPSDIYSLGVVLYEMLAGRRPFDADNPKDMVMAHLHKEPPRPSYHNPELPAALDRLVMDMMAKDFEKRIDGAPELLVRLCATPEITKFLGPEMEHYKGEVRRMPPGAAPPRRRRPLPIVKPKKRRRLRELIALGLGAS